MKPGHDFLWCWPVVALKGLLRVKGHRSEACLFVICCLLFVVCCLLFVVCCLLFVVCCLLFVVSFQIMRQVVVSNKYRIEKRKISELARLHALLKGVSVFASGLLRFPQAIQPNRPTRPSRLKQPDRLNQPGRLKQLNQPTRPGHPGHPGWLGKPKMDRRHHSYLSIMTGGFLSLFLFIFLFSFLIFKSLKSKRQKLDKQNTLSCNCPSPPLSL